MPHPFFAQGVRASTASHLMQFGSEAVSVFAIDRARAINGRLKCPRKKRNNNNDLHECNSDSFNESGAGAFALSNKT